MTNIVSRSPSRSPEVRSDVLITPSEYAVTLLTHEVDEHGAGWERRVNVVWNAGVTPDWNSWLELYDPKREYYTNLN
jgi:hypothetical protein